MTTHEEYVEPEGARDVAKVIGVGGVFFKSEEPDKLYQWYSEHLGIKKNDGPGVSIYDGRSATGWVPGLGGIQIRHPVF